MDTNKMIGQAYLDGLRRNLFVQPTVYPHFFKNKPPLVMYRPQPFVTDSNDQESCDSQQRSPDPPTAEGDKDPNAHL